MKTKNLFGFCLIFLAGCNSKEAVDAEISKTDSIIIAADNVMAKSDSIGRAVDSITTHSIEQVTNNFENLQKEVEKVKIEKKKTQTIIIRDTIYIETKKNFWGKTKKSVNVISDSTSKIDSIIIE